MAECSPILACAQRQSETKFVYVMSAGANLQKIGYAKHPGKRLAHIQSASPEPVSLFVAIEVPGRDARAVERHAHWLLRDRRHRGEWFNVSAKAALGAIEGAVQAVTHGVAWTLRRSAAPARHKARVSPIATLQRTGALTSTQAEAALRYQWAVRRVMEGRAGRSVASLRNDRESEIDLRRWLARLNAEIDAELGRDARAILQAVAVEGYALRSAALKGIAPSRVRDRLRAALDIVLMQPSPLDLAFVEKVGTT